MESRYYDPEIETASRDEIRSLQERKHNAIVQHASAHSSFYRSNTRPRIVWKIES